VKALDIAKRLLDYGYMSPTIYFPSLVEEALMIEPTETETKETLDKFADTLIEIAKEDPAIVHAAPSNTSVGRVDELYAARELILTWKDYLAVKDGQNRSG
jgi:glycine dehydrogenase subunit 2